jgi:hypothetical protein
MNMDTENQQPVTTINKPEDIPAFASEDQEHAFWAAHELSDDLWDQAESLEPDELPPPRTISRPITLRFDEHTLARIQALARSRHKGYQTLLKEFIIERLYEEEKRDDLLTPVNAAPRTGKID